MQGRSGETWGGPFVASPGVVARTFDHADVPTTPRLPFPRYPSAERGYVRTGERKRSQQAQCHRYAS